MFEHARIAVVVPAYNEERHIGVTLRGIPSFVDAVIVVDDGSRDATRAAVHELGDPRVQLLGHEHNLGVGAALWTGYRHAFTWGADVVAVMAGDNQMHPDDLPALLAPVVRGDADYAKGDRLSHPDAFTHMPFARFVGNHMLSLLTRLATGVRASDSQCGYTALHRRAYARLVQDAPWRGYGYPNDLIGTLARAGLRVRDVTVRPVYADETSGIRLHHALLVVPFVLARALLRRITVRWSTPALEQPQSRAPLPVSAVVLLPSDSRLPHGDR